MNHNVLSLTDPDGNTTNWTYNGHGLEATQTQTTTLGYEMVGGVRQVQTATALTTNDYNLDGDLTETIDPDGRATTFSYDSQNQEVGENWYSTSTLANPTNTFAFQYDTLGDTIAASNNAASYAFQFDTVGNVTGQSISLAGLPSNKNVVLLSGYDFNDNRTSLKANIGGSLTDTDGASGVTGGTNDFQEAANYDALGDMTSLSQTGQSTGDSNNGVAAKNVTFSYDADQRTSTVNMYQSSGTSSLVASAANTYDADSDLTDLTYTDASSNTLAAYHWVYNTLGEVTCEYSLKDSAAATTYSDGYTTWAHTTLGYDHDGELTSAGYANFAHAPEALTTDASTSQSQTFDSNGNREGTTDVSTPSGGGSATTTSTSPASSTNLLLFDGTYYYNYDPAGNRVAKFESTTGLLDSTATNITIYAWNNANELVSAKTYDTYAHYIANDTPTSEVDYTNDPFGEMVSRTVKDDTGTVTENDNYIYDGGNVALVLNADGQVTQRNLYGPAVDQILATETVAPVSMGEQAAGLVNWLLPNNQGTIRDVAQYSGGATTVVDHLVYDSFGTITSQTNATYQPFMTYAGMQLDTVTGLYYDNARWYDAQNSIFISQDPIGFNDGGTNLAMYCANSPTNYVDPSGLEDEDDDGENGATWAFGIWPFWLDEADPNGYDSYGETESESNRAPETDGEGGETDSENNNFGNLPRGFGPSSGWQTNRAPGNPFATGNGPWTTGNGGPTDSLPSLNIPSSPIIPDPSASETPIAPGSAPSSTAIPPSLPSPLAEPSSPGSLSFSAPGETPLSEAKAESVLEDAQARHALAVGTIESGSASGSGESVPTTGASTSAGARMAAEEALENGKLNLTSAQRLGITAPPQHHIFPQEQKKWFADRGIEVDDSTVTLDNATHEALHYGEGGGWWNETIMDMLNEREAELGRQLTPEEIEAVGQQMMERAGLQGKPIVPYGTR